MENENLIHECIKKAIDFYPSTLDIPIGSPADLVYRLLLMSLDILEYGK